MSENSAEARLVERVRDVLAEFEYNEVDRPAGVESGLVRIRPTAENAIMNNGELAALRASGFVLDHVDMDNEEVWVRG